MKLAKTILLLGACTSSAIAFADCASITGTLESNQPGYRTYKSEQGYTIYEGSLFRNLIDISKIEGMDGIQPNGLDDVHLIKRLHTPVASLESAITLINENLSGHKVVVSGSKLALTQSDTILSYAPNKTFAPITKQSNKESCAAGAMYAFKTIDGTLNENISRFEELSGWEFVWESGSEESKRIAIDETVIVGSSYYEILAKLLATTGVGAVYN